MLRPLARTDWIEPGVAFFLAVLHARSVVSNHVCVRFAGKRVLL